MIPDAVADPASAATSRAVHGFGTAVSWSYVSKLGRWGTTFVVSLLLGRLLGPNAFGTIAMAIVYVYFAELLVRQGLSAAVVQSPRLTPLHLDTAFWMTVMAVAALTPVAIGLSGVWAAANQLPDLQPVIVALSPVLLLKGISVVQGALLTRQMDFRALATRTNVGVVVGGVAGVATALIGWGVWALVTQQLVTAVLEAGLLWWLSDWRPRLRFDRGAARELLGFSGHSALAGLGAFLNQRSDALLIGLLFGPVAVGLYRMASRFTDAALEVASGALHSVSLSELSRHAEDIPALRARAVELVRLAALLTVPLLGVVAAVAAPVMALLGPEWGPAADALVVLCAVGFLSVVASYIGPVLQAAGRPGVLAALAWSNAVVSALAFVAAGLMLAGADDATQVVGAAAARLIALVIILAVVVAPALRRVLGLRAAVLFGVLLRSVGAAITGVVVVAGLDAWIGITVSLGPWPAFVVVGTVATTVIGALTLAWEPLSRQLLRGAFRRLRRRRDDDRPQPPVDAAQDAALRG